MTLVGQIVWNSNTHTIDQIRLISFRIGDETSPQHTMSSLIEEDQTDTAFAIIPRTFSFISQQLLVFSFVLMSSQSNRKDLIAEFSQLGSCHNKTWNSWRWFYVQFMSNSNCLFAQLNRCSSHAKKTNEKLVPAVKVQTVFGTRYGNKNPESISSMANLLFKTLEPPFSLHSNVSVSSCLRGWLSLALFPCFHSAIRFG